MTEQAMPLRNVRVTYFVRFHAEDQGNLRRPNKLVGDLAPFTLAHILPSLQKCENLKNVSLTFFKFQPIPTNSVSD